MYIVLGTIACILYVLNYGQFVPLTHTHTHTHTHTWEDREHLEMSPGTNYIGSLTCCPAYLLYFNYILLIVRVSKLICVFVSCLNNSRL